MTTETQVESRTERATVALTKSEKDSLRLVATVERLDESNLLRDRTLAEIVDRADAIRVKLNDGAA